MVARRFVISTTATPLTSFTRHACEFSRHFVSGISCLCSLHDILTKSEVHSCYNYTANKRGFEKGFTGVHGGAWGLWKAETLSSLPRKLTDLFIAYRGTSEARNRWRISTSTGILIISSRKRRYSVDHHFLLVDCCNYMLLSCAVSKIGYYHFYRIRYCRWSWSVFSAWFPGEMLYLLTLRCIRHSNRKSRKYRK